MQIHAKNMGRTCKYILGKKCLFMDPVFWVGSCFLGGCLWLLLLRLVLHHLDPMPLVQLAWPILLWFKCCALMPTVRCRIGGGGGVLARKPSDTVGDSCYGWCCIIFGLLPLVQLAWPIRIWFILLRCTQCVAARGGGVLERKPSIALATNVAR